MKTAKSVSKKIARLGKKQKKQPGKEFIMKLKPKVDNYNYKGNNKLKNKIFTFTSHNFLKIIQSIRLNFRIQKSISC